MHVCMYACITIKINSFIHENVYNQLICTRLCLFVTCAVILKRPNLPLLQFPSEEYVGQLGLAIDWKHAVVLRRHDIVEVDCGGLENVCMYVYVGIKKKEELYMFIYACMYLYVVNVCIC